MVDLTKLESIEMGGQRRAMKELTVTNVPGLKLEGSKLKGIHQKVM